MFLCPQPGLDRARSPARSVGRRHCRNRIIVQGVSAGASILGLGVRMRSIEERRAVARRVFETLCERYPDRYITFIERPGIEEPSPERPTQADFAEGAPER
jgi:hypothetical protein